MSLADARAILQDLCLQFQTNQELSMIQQIHSTKQQTENTFKQQHQQSDAVIKGTPNHLYRSVLFAQIFQVDLKHLKRN